jgi:hypothetical protein
MGVTGFDKLLLINTISQRDNCKLRWIILNGNTKENTQVQANMTVVHNILNGGNEYGITASEEVELVEAA